MANTYRVRSRVSPAYRTIIAALIATCVLVRADEPYAERYIEPVERSHANRQTGYTQVQNYIETLHDRAPALRDARFDPDFSSRHAYAISSVPLRERVRKSIGFPPPFIARCATPRWELVATEFGSHVYRVWVEVLDGVDAYALVTIPQRIKTPAPLMICQHGGGGNPELIHGMLEGVGTGNYGWMTQRALAEGYVTLEPALLFPFGGKEAFEGPDRRTMDEQLQNLGTSILAVELWKIFRLIDVVTQRAEVDRDRIGMMGLSYGGLYTLYATALDPRIDAAVSSCFFNERRRYSWQDWSFFGYMNNFNDAEVCALICPRPLLIEVGNADTLFAIEGAKAEFERAKRYWGGLQISGLLVLDVFDGGHEFKGNEAYAFMRKHVKKEGE